MPRASSARACSSLAVEPSSSATASSRRADPRVPLEPAELRERAADRAGRAPRARGRELLRRDARSPRRSRSSRSSASARSTRHGESGRVAVVPRSAARTPRSRAARPPSGPPRRAARIRACTSEARGVRRVALVAVALEHRRGRPATSPRSIRTSVRNASENARGPLPEAVDGEALVGPAQERPRPPRGRRAGTACSRARAAARRRRAASRGGGRTPRSRRTLLERLRAGRPGPAAARSGSRAAWSPSRAAPRPRAPRGASATHSSTCPPRLTQS